MDIRGVIQFVLDRLAKHWEVIFSGIGVAILGGIWAIFRSKKQQVTVQNLSESIKLLADRILTGKPGPPDALRNRKAMLEKVKNTWVKGMLEESLHGAVLIELGLQERKELVARPWDMVLQTPEKPDRSLPTGTNIVDVFDEMSQALIILGEPGSGKTTTLLELARDTITRAEKDHTQPIPVVFNLSSWIDPKQSIADWLVEELNTKYFVPKRIGDQWVKNDEMLLLLDGIDEVALERREACVNAINMFRQEHLTQIAVCSRIADYQILKCRLNLHSAVVLQPLAPQQVDGYLNRAGSQLAAVRQVLQDDPTLQKLAQSPLMLSIMVLAYQRKAVQELQVFDSLDKRRKHLFDTYVDSMFNRPARTKNELYSRELTLYYLAWLAQRMSQHGESVLLIEKIQPSWLGTKAQQCWHTIKTAINCGLITAMLGGLTDIVTILLGPSSIVKDSAPEEVKKLWLAFAVIRVLMVGLISGGCGLTLGLVWGCMRKQIKTVESLMWSWPKLRQVTKASIKFYAILVLSFALPTLLIDSLCEGITSGLIATLEVTILFIDLAILVWLFLWPFFALVGPEPEIRMTPNQGIWDSGKTSLIVWVRFSLIFGSIFVIIGLIDPYASGLDIGETLIGALLSGWLYALFIALYYGGFTFIQHFTLRSILNKNYFLPWNLARFLDYAADHIFLRKVGGGYIFIHRLLQDYFASRMQTG